MKSKKSTDQSLAGAVRLNLTERTAYRFLNLAGKVMGSLAAMYGPRFGLTIAKWKVLSMIGAHGPLSASELSALTSLEPDKITRNVDALVQKGLVIRREDPMDRRRVILTLSRKGKSVNESIEHVRRCIEVDFLMELNERELVALYAILDKLDERTQKIFGDKDSWRASVSRSANVVVHSAKSKKSLSGRQFKKSRSSVGRSASRMFGLSPESSAKNG